MEKDLENLFVECIGDFRDICSSMVILQNAIQNEFTEIEPIDIDHYLSIILNKFEQAFEKADKFQEIIGA